MKVVLKSSGRRMWTEFVWFKIKSSDWFFRTRQQALGFYKKDGRVSPGKQPLVSEKMLFNVISNNSKIFSHVP
jgi:hypothetical protein